MLVLAGMGIHDIKDMSVKALEAVKRADAVYAEFYTSMPESSIRDVEELTGREIKLLSREEVESCSILREAKEKLVVLLVPGDPMVATTHSALVLEAKKQGIETEIIHGSSVSSAVCVTGLQFYRFGKTATVSYPLGSVVSSYPVNVVRQNWSINAHTLLLLDLNPPMKVKTAIDLLFKAGLEDWFGVALSDLGGKCEMLCNRLSKLKCFSGKGLHSLVVLARTLHFMEYECLRAFAKAPEELEKIVE